MVTDGPPGPGEAATGTRLPFPGAWLGLAPRTPPTSHWKGHPPHTAATPGREGHAPSPGRTEVPGAWLR